MRMTIPVAVGELAAEDTGGDGRPVVLVHAGWCDSTSWDGVLALLPAGTRAIRYDSRGYGRSPASAGPYTELGDLVTVLTALDVEDAVVAGHSGGGATALGLALHHPERVHALTLAAPGVSDYPWREEGYFTEFGACWEAGDREGLVRLGLRTWAPADPGPAAERQIRSAVTAFFRNGEHVQPDPPALARLGEIRVPAEVVVGDLDYPDVIDCTAAVADRIPGARRATLPGADHLLPLRVPDLLAGIIAGQLAGPA